MGSDTASGLLSGVKVLDLTHALAGPMCTYQLHVQGAEVIKVEPPERGDDFRARPYGRFSCINGGKRSVTLNLKSPDSRDVLDKLLAEADVVVENFRPGVAKEFGLDWDAMHATYPRLIYCSISGFGQTGPMRDFPAIEWSAQSVSGMAHSYLDGNDDAMDLGVGMLDPCTGFLAASSIIAALYRRTQTGEGSRIDVAMIDTAFMLGSNGIAATLLDGPTGLGRRPTMARYKTKEGRIFIASLHPRWFAKLCELLDAPEMLEDPRFATPGAREENGEALVTALESKLASKPALEWEAILVSHGIPAGAARSFRQMAESDHAKQRGMTLEFDAPEGRITAVGAAFKLSDTPTGVRGPTPDLGADTDDVLSYLGYDAARISALRSGGVI